MSDELLDHQGRIGWELRTAKMNHKPNSKTIDPEVDR